MDDLYHFRDHYFENHDVEKAAEKIDDITEQLKKTLKIIDEHRGRLLHYIATKFAKNQFLQILAKKRLKL